MKDLFLNTKQMEIFKELKKLGYKHYTEYTIEELDNLPLNSDERIMEQSLVLRWFRENYRLSILIHDCLDDYIGEIVEWTLTEDKIIHEVPNRIKTYEEAELRCLLKLIEIIESKSE